MTLKLEELKEKYELLRKKHKLPVFGDINKYFDIDRIERESDILLKEFRKSMMDKIIEYVRFVEMLINPVNAPPIFMQFAKKIDIGERKTLEGIYEKFILLELRAIENDISYEDAREAELIGVILEVWKSCVKDLLSVVAFMRRNLEIKTEKKDKTYWG